MGSLVCSVFSVLNPEAIVGVFNQEKALEGLLRDCVNFMDLRFQLYCKLSDGGAAAPVSVLTLAAVIVECGDKWRAALACTTT